MQRDTLLQRGAALEAMAKSLPVPNIPPKKGR